MKFKIALLLIVALLGVIVYGWFELEDHKSISENLQQAMEVREKAYSKLFINWVTDKQIDMGEWSKDTFFKTVFTSENGKFYAEKKLAELDEAYGLYKTIAIADPNGNIVISTHPSFTDNIKDKQYFQTAIEGNIPKPTIAQCPNEICSVITVAQPIKDNDELIIGVMLGIFTIDTYFE